METGYIHEDENGMDYVNISKSKSSAKIYLFGAHVTEYKCQGKEVLFVSKKAVFKPPKAIRGGIPVIWPQFSNRGDIKQSHGFARNIIWRAEAVEENSVTMVLEDSAETRKLWPYSFRVEYTVSIGDDEILNLKYKVIAKGDDLSFTFALHSYFATEDIDQVAVEGLKGCKFQDHLSDMKVKTETNAQLGFEGEVDRTYMNAPRVLRIVENQSKGKVTTRLCTSDNLVDAVVWNPWIAKSKRMGDFGDEEYRNMVCVEVGSVVAPVLVQAGESWEASHQISRTFEFQKPKL